MLVEEREKEKMTYDPKINMIYNLFSKIKWKKAFTISFQKRLNLSEKGKCINHNYLPTFPPQAVHLEHNLK